MSAVEGSQAGPYCSLRRSLAFLLSPKQLDSGESEDPAGGLVVLPFLRCSWCFFSSSGCEGDSWVSAWLRLDYEQATYAVSGHVHT